MIPALITHELSYAKAVPNVICIKGGKVTLILQLLQKAQFLVLSIK